jgi:predicted RNA binding protein YcfA (HicA-like mRNA interferase family)
MPLNVKVRVLKELLKEHGWIYRNTEGDHHHFVHPTRTGKVTLVGSDNRAAFGMLLASILKQAGLTMKELRTWLSR